MRLPERVRSLARGLPLACLVLAGCATARLDATPPVQSYLAAPGALAPVASRNDDTIRIMTLNIAHGRGDSFHQLLQGSATTLANLDSIATLLRNSGAQVVALQEADGPSFWSGNFNHIDYLARNGAFSHSVHGMHADGLGLAYGTALMANLDLTDPRAITFDPALSPVHAQTYALAQAISDHLIPATRAYAEIWLDEEGLPVAEVRTSSAEMGQGLVPQGGFVKGAGKGGP